MKRRTLRWIGLIAFVLGGCTAKRQLTAEQYFDLGNRYLREGAYQASVEQYRELLDQYPFSEHSEEAELKIAHGHYLNGSCPEAVAAFADFQRRHPTSPHLAFAGYLIGRCYEAQMHPADRDQSAAQNAHAYFLAVIEQYPESPFADLARAHMRGCRERIARHELLIAQFYLRREKATAAEYRLLDLVNRFNDTDTAGEALFVLGELYRERGATDRAALAFGAVVRHHPDNGVSRAAREALVALPGEGALSAPDPLAVLRTKTGRSRMLALAQAVEVVPMQQSAARPGIAPGAMSAGPSGRTNPFGR